MTADWTQNTARLKLLVAIMTALLVAGLVLLAVGMARTAGKMTRSENPTASVADASVPFGELKLRLPAGVQIVEMTTGDGRLYLRTEDEAGLSVIYVIDGKDGRHLGRILLEAAP